MSTDPERLRGNAAPGNAAPGNAAPGNAAPGNKEPGNKEPGDDEPSVPHVQASASLLRGAIAHGGLLSIVGDQIRFRATGDLDRQLGARDIDLPLDELTALSASPAGDFLALTAAGTSLRFSGAQLGGIVTVLRRRLPGLGRGPDGAAIGTRSDSLLSGIVDLQVGSAPWTAARMVLSQDLLQVIPIERVRGGEGLDPQSLRPADLLEVDLQPKGGALSLRTAGLSLQLRGALTVAAADRLGRLMRGEPAEPVTESMGPTLRAAWWRGPIVHRGQISLSSTALRFEPTGLLDNLIGVKAFTIPWAQVRRIRRPGGDDRVVEISHAGQRHRIELLDDEHGFVRMVRMVHHEQLRAALEPEGVNLWSRALLGAWRGREPAARELPLLLTPALLLDGGDARTGAWMLTGSTVAFLPEDPDDEPGLRSWPTADLSRSHRLDDDFADSLRFDARGESLRVVHALGPAFLSAFWARCRAPARTYSWQGLSPRTVARLTGAAHSVTLVIGDRRIETQPGLTVLHPRGWAASRCPRRLQRVTVELGQLEGVYQFDAVVDEPVPLPARLRERGDPPRYLLVLQDRGDIRLFNQREGLRAAGTCLPASSPW